MAVVEVVMKSIIVDRDSWGKFFYHEYKLTGKQFGHATKEALFEKYGIEHWVRLNLDEYKISFVDDKKMTFWVLKWS